MFYFSASISILFFLSSCPSALGEISYWIQFLAWCLTQQKRMWHCGEAFQGNCSWLVGGTQGIMVHPGDLSDRKSSVRPSLWIFRSVKLWFAVGPPYGGPVLLLHSLSVCRRNKGLFNCTCKSLAPEQREWASALVFEQGMCKRNSLVWD